MVCYGSLQISFLHYPRIDMDSWETKKNSYYHDYNLDFRLFLVLAYSRGDYLPLGKQMSRDDR